TNSLSTIIDLLELKLANIYYLQENKKSLIELCKKNNLFECFFYLNYEMDEYNFTSFQIGEKTTKNITYLLEKLSVGQVFYIISKRLLMLFYITKKNRLKSTKGKLLTLLLMQ
ncbi:hypothetical protein L7834_013420, partial [Providencia rettgeri]|uniref:hypothetical protein n=1 Tax=Providencia rettgeri TaxID=587 RepID=UPI001EE6E08B